MISKTIFITGSTDGIGLETAKMLASQGHYVLLHGRSPEKLKKVEEEIFALIGGAKVQTYVADLSSMDDVEALAKAVARNHGKLDVLINNAGVYMTSNRITSDGLDVRFAVNTVAPYLLTKRLLPLLGKSGRVLNLSSAAQSTVNLKALAGQIKLSDRDAYAQSKLSLTMWTFHMASSLKDSGLVIVAVNPGSLLNSKMVKEAFGKSRGDVRVGAEILCRLALDDEFTNVSGKYFDNDSGRFASPHLDALDSKKCTKVVAAIEVLLDKQTR